MVAPALIAAAWNMPGHARDWKELPPESAALLVEFGGADDGRARRARRARAAEMLARATSCCARASSRATPRQIEMAWRVREGMFGLVGRLRPPGTALIIEDVCVPPGADRRVRARPAGAARRARLPAGRRRPRVGGQPALHADAGLLRSPRTSSATRRSWGSWSS